MQIAFYAPFKPPDGAASTDDRNPASFFMAALARTGHAVELVSGFRSYDEEGDPDRQLALRDEGAAIARALASQWRNGKRAPRPDIWFTHHGYYKAPDWLGPFVTAELGIPYVIAETSHAPKHAGGRWATGHDATIEAVRHAALVLGSTRQDVSGVTPLVFDRERVVRLPPFLDSEPFRRAAGLREEYRGAIAATYQLDSGVPWIMVASRMEPGDKTASYRALAAALAQLLDLPWRLIIAGDGPARNEIEAEINAALPGRACFLGNLVLAEIAPVFAASDLYVWPAVNETFGKAKYEAQAAGIAIVSCAPRGVPDSVADGKSGVRVPPGDTAALAQVVRGLLVNPARRASMGRAAAAFISAERSLDAAAIRLNRALARVAPGT